MDSDDLLRLQNHLDKTVRIFCVDGEVVTAKLLVVSEEDEDVIFDLLTTNRQDKYEKLDKQPAYLLRFQNIAHVEAVSIHKAEKEKLRE
jgi:hypothetical protein